MDFILLGLLVALAVAFGAALWQLLVSPHALLSLWRDPAVPEAWMEEHPAALRALRWVAGIALFLLGFLTGLVAAFLGSTAS